MSPKLVPFVCAACAFGAFELADAIAPRFTRQNATPLAYPPQKRLISPEPTHQSGRSDKTATLKLAEPPTNVRSLKELTVACEYAGSPAQSRLALMEAINRLKPEELELLLAKEAGNTDFYRSSRFDFQFAARRLSEMAPERAAALWLKTKSTHYGVDTLLLPWAKKDPQGFAAWSVTLPPDAQRAMAGTVGQCVAENPENLIHIAAQIKDTPAGMLGARSAIAGMISMATKGSDPGIALSYARGLPEGPMRTAALAELARWPGFDLKAHPEVVQAMASLAPGEARRYLPQISSAADSLPAGGLRDAAFAAQISGAAKKDPQAAAKRVEALQGTPDYSAAVRGFVDATVTKDPTAAIEWALTIEPQSKQRSAVLEKAAAEFFRQKPTEARKWVQSAQLTSAEYQLLTGQSR